MLSEPGHVRSDARHTPLTPCHTAPPTACIVVSARARVGWLFTYAHGECATKVIENDPWTGIARVVHCVPCIGSWKRLPPLGLCSNSRVDFVWDVGDDDDAHQLFRGCPLGKTSARLTTSSSCLASDHDLYSHNSLNSLWPTTGDMSFIYILNTDMFCGVVGRRHSICMPVCKAGRGLMPQAYSGALKLSTK